MISNTRTCYRCGSPDIHEGTLWNAPGDVFFVPGKESKQFIRGTSKVEVAARICLDCGTIELIGSLDTVKQKKKKPPVA